ncbi:hypothetical protein BD414DRAFT_493569 [Trametes punicea]|nr:hypothetical protein BD414DRAFT_493569 [Trametes punicea]
MPPRLSLSASFPSLRRGRGRRSLRRRCHRLLAFSEQNHLTVPVCPCPWPSLPYSLRPTFLVWPLPSRDIPPSRPPRPSCHRKSPASASSPWASTSPVQRGQPAPNAPVSGRVPSGPNPTISLPCPPTRTLLGQTRRATPRGSTAEKQASEHIPHPQTATIYPQTT